MYWGYLHQNGTIQVKRWLGDHKDYEVVSERANEASHERL